MSTDFITSILSEFAQSCQLGELSFDNDDCCHLIIDGELAVTLHAGQDSLIIAGQLSQTKPSLEKILTLIPILNDKPFIGWNPEIGLVGYKYIPQQLLTISVLEQATGEFIEWMKLSQVDVKPRPPHEMQHSYTSLPLSSLRV